MKQKKAPQSTGLFYNHLNHFIFLNAYFDHFLFKIKRLPNDEVGQPLAFDLLPEGLFECQGFDLHVFTAAPVIVNVCHDIGNRGFHDDIAIFVDMCIDRNGDLLSMTPVTTRNPATDVELELGVIRH